MAVVARVTAREGLTGEELDQLRQELAGVKARLDEEDLTLNPDLAGAESSSSDSESGCGSEGSLPAGPPPMTMTS